MQKCKIIVQFLKFEDHGTFLAKKKISSSFGSKTKAGVGGGGMDFLPLRTE